MASKRGRKRKLKDPVTLFASIRNDQHEAIREIAFKERRSMADLVREALNLFLKNRRKAGSA